MTQDIRNRKINIFIMRYDGKSIMEIAKEVGISKQRVSFLLNHTYDFILSFLLTDSSYTPFLDGGSKIERETAIEIYRMIADKKNVEEIKKEVGVSDRDIAEAVSYFCGNQKKMVSEYNRELYAWINQNKVPFLQLSENLGINSEMLYKILIGERGMTSELAGKLNEITGIPVKTLLDSSNCDAPYPRKYTFRHRANSGN